MVTRTKIVATVGPACGSVEKLRALAKAGADVFRINFSHGDEAQREAFLRNIRQVEAESGEPLPVIGDLCGPKIRVGLVRGGGVLLGVGQEVVIQRQPIEGTPGRISTTLAELVDCVEPGQAILLDDGKIRLEVAGVRPPEEVVCRVVVGGVLGSGKGINLPHTSMALSALTEKDRADAAWIARREFDYVALSFVRQAQDVRQLRAILDAAGGRQHIIAKIEKPQALRNIDGILDAADAIMVARGDLGVEMDLPSVPAEQKRLALLAQRAGKACIIATQMLETMTHSPTPTRAEVSDVANAVLDHGDAVMLSGETSVGEYPVEAVEMMNAIVQRMQTYDEGFPRPVHVACPASRTTAALADAVRAIIAGDAVAAVAVFSTSGQTARVLAKSRLSVPIVAMAPDAAVVRRMCLYYGVVARQAAAPRHTRDVLALAERFAGEACLAQPGEKIIVLSGRPIGVPGTTNTLVVHKVES
jgi:pyruvate kinase